MIRSRQQGFTLIELMMVIVIIAILAALAIPTYNQYIAKNRRTIVQAELVELAQKMAKNYVTRFSYDGLSDVNDDDGDGNTREPKPSVFRGQSPLNGVDKYYDFVVETDDQSYRLIATPIGRQTGDGRVEFSSDGERCWFQGEDRSGGNCDVW